MGGRVDSNLFPGCAVEVDSDNVWRQSATGPQHCETPFPSPVLQPLTHPQVVTRAFWLPHMLTDFQLRSFLSPTRGPRLVQSRSDTRKR